MPMGLNISPSICQSYINMILECLQSKEHSEAIMDEFIAFHTFKTCTYSKIRKFIEIFI